VSDVYIVALISFLVFVAVVILVEGAYLLWHGIHEEGVIKINRRLKMLSAGGAQAQSVLAELLRRKTFSDISFINRILMRIPRLHALDRLLEQAAVKVSVGQFLLIQLLLMIVIAGLLIVFANLHYLICIIIAVPLGILLPSLYVIQKRQQRRDAFARQLPEALDFIARSMRAGNPFSASLKAVAREMPDPIGTEFGITFDEMNYGLELEDALHNLGNRTGSEEMHFFITAVLIQRTTGGNLADVLNKIAAVMRARASTVREIMILSAEMRLSARVLIALPFIVAGALTLLNPTYLSILFKSPIGQVIIGIQLLLMLFGYIILRRMVNFRI
jgi:tight adherence protein B